MPSTPCSMRSATFWASHTSFSGEVFAINTINDFCINSGDVPSSERLRRDRWLKSLSARLLCGIYSAGDCPPVLMMTTCGRSGFCLGIGAAQMLVCAFADFFDFHVGGGLDADVVPLFILIMMLCLRLSGESICPRRFCLTCNLRMSRRCSQFVLVDATLRLIA